MKSHSTTPKQVFQFLKLGTLLLLCNFCLNCQIHADNLKGMVVGVHDGDTITVLDNQKEHKIRLIGIDAPESKQAFGQKSKQTLSTLVYGKNVEVKLNGKKSYNRELGEVRLNGEYINLTMIKKGMAWHYKKYSQDKEMEKAEIQARKDEIGIWSDPHAIPPWDYRKKK